jgi:prephenate dehydrogenase
MTPPDLRSVLVVGTGLIGASVGLALRARGIAVVLDDADPATLALAVDRGAGVPAGEHPAVDLAVVAVPPQASAAAVLHLLDDPRVRAVTDTASVKQPVAQAVRAHPRAAAYVGGHPMAGREVSGPAGARADLFRGRSWVLCPAPEATPDETAAAVELVTQLALLVGATPVRMTPSDHDAAVALVSHAPHVVSALVAGRLRDAAEPEVRLAGSGVTDITRVAASDPAMWREILAVNGSAVRDVLVALRADLDTAISALQQGDLDEVETLLAAGVAGRGRLPGKHGSPHAEYVGVPVELADRPGQLARLFADIGTAGVNVEDVRIEHVPGEPVGLVELSVAPGAVHPLLAALRDRGWTVHG